MDQKELRDLLKVYRKHGYEEGELKKLWDLLSDDNNEEQVKSGLISEISTFDLDNVNQSDADFDQMFKKIQTKISTNQPKEISFIPRKIFTIYKAAAILILAFTIGGALSYFIFNKPQPLETAFTIIKAPYGAKSEVVLPDGSHVWINAGSSIKYDNNYNKTTRTLLLEGEAYFKVAKNKNIPFIVNTADIDIVAVGTEFNVKAYADEDIIETTLVEGKVTIKGDENSKNKDLKEISLEPKQKAVYLRNNKKVQITNKTSSQIVSRNTERMPQGLVYVAKRIDPVPIIAWKDSKLIIRGEELSSIAIKLERKYNVNILFDSKAIMKYRFSGTLEDETLTQVLDVIKLTSPIDYDLQGKDVKIYENSSMTKKFSNYLNRK